MSHTSSPRRTRRAVHAARHLAGLALFYGTLAATTALADENAPAFLRLVETNFPNWDANHDQSLSPIEIDRAIADPAVTGANAAAAVALHRGLRAAKAPSISLAQLQTTEKSPAYVEYFVWGDKRLKDAKRELFVSPAPRIEMLKQGKIGDCFCLAALRTVLHRDPLEITRMIESNPAGGYRTRLGTSVIDTPAPTDGEIILGASTADGLWPLVYEKAVGISRMKPNAKDATPFSVVTKGGSAGSMMSVLTARKITRWSCKTWRDAAPDAAKQAELVADLRRQLTSAFAEKRLVTGGTGSLGKDAKRVPGLNYGHGYAVLGFDPEKDSITLWNPHADDFTPKGPPSPEHGYTMKGGHQTIPLTELITFFGGFALEQPATAAGAN